MVQMEGAEEEPHADGGEMEEEEAEEEESGLFREGGTGRDAGEMGEEESESFLASGVQENDVPSDVQPAARASSVASHASKPRAPRGQPRPEPGSVLRYFDSEEGLVALSKGMIVERPVGQGRTHYPGQDSVTVEDLEAIRKERRQARKSAATGVSVGGRSRGRAGYAASEKGAPSVHGSIASGIAAHVVRSRQGSIQRESTRAPADELTAEGAESEAFPVGFGEPLPRERPWEKSVTGGERRLVPELPDYMTRAVAEPVVNMRHLSVESEAFKMSRTAAGMNLQARGRFTKEFEVSPDAVDLGVLEIGQRATATLRITNIAAELARFHVERLAEPWHVVYRPGPLAVGMTTAVTVVFIASEPGVFTTSVNIRTESVVFRVPGERQRACGCQRLAGCGVRAANDALRRPALARALVAS